MNERLCVKSVTLVDPNDAQALAALQHYFYAPCDMTIVYLSGAPEKDDAGLTIDVNDDGSATGILAVACAVAAVPGTWKAIGYGGTNAPVKIAAGSLVTIDVNDAAVATSFILDIWYLTGEAFS